MSNHVDNLNGPWEPPVEKPELPKKKRKRNPNMMNEGTELPKELALGLRRIAKENNITPHRLRQQIFKLAYDKLDSGEWKVVRETEETNIAKVKE